MSALPPDDADVDRLLDVLLVRYAQDFRRYARASLLRRLVRLLEQREIPSVDALLARMEADPALVHVVLDALTVQVTEMFRDPPFFASLRANVLPVLATWPSIKVWVAGCATGEEAWSIAILLDEAGLLERSLIYATDISASALRTAEAGIYPIDHLAEHARRHRAAGGTRSLSEYFSTGYGRAVVDRRLRDRVVVADHSLATDSVFSEVHLVTCRNVLIYFDRALQHRALGLFHDALVLGGFLGLGSRETLHGSPLASSFEAVDRPWRVYRRIA